MSASLICRCTVCSKKLDSTQSDQHREMILMISKLRPSERRLYAAIESKKIGFGGCKLVAEITRLSRQTIARGRKELAAELSGTPIKAATGRPGRRPIEQKHPEIKDVLETLLDTNTGGDPMTLSKWTRISTRNLSKKLATLGYTVNYHTVWRLLRQMGYSMKMTVKSRCLTAYAPKRDEQFRYIASQKNTFLAAGNPVISVDAKKKELIGQFHVHGRSWSKAPTEVNAYSFASLAECVATPYGIYDLQTNKGYVYVNTSGDTPSFAVWSIKKWWLEVGRHVYPNARDLLILADGGGSNGCRCRAWKREIQLQICDLFGLSVTVCHFPTGCSKYNPIERRLFSHISMNWSGKPLATLDVMLNYIRGTTTESGLYVEAIHVKEAFPAGVKIAPSAMKNVNLQSHLTIPLWNYTISSQK